jgi:hypothetical protein
MITATLTPDLRQMMVTDDYGETLYLDRESACELWDKVNALLGMMPVAMGDGDTGRAASTLDGTTNKG